MSLVAGIGCPDTILKANTMNPTVCKQMKFRGVCRSLGPSECARVKLVFSDCLVHGEASETTNHKGFFGLLLFVCFPESPKSQWTTF